MARLMSRIGPVFLAYFADMAQCPEYGQGGLGYLIQITPFQQRFCGYLFITKQVVCILSIMILVIGDLSFYSSFGYLGRLHFLIKNSAFTQRCAGNDPLFVWP